jgi:hypothetical protein
MQNAPVVNHIYHSHHICFPLQAARLGVPSPATFVGVGDNPLSDIRGANAARLAAESSADSRRDSEPPQRAQQVTVGSAGLERAETLRRPRWTSVLVRTGVWAGGDNDPTDRADLVVDDVNAAVAAVLGSAHASA